MREFEYYFRLPAAERKRIRKAIQVLMRAGMTFELAVATLLGEYARLNHYRFVERTGT